MVQTVKNKEKYLDRLTEGKAASSDYPLPS